MTETLPYVSSLYKPKRRKTREVRVGDVLIGAHRPIVIQSMTTPSTLDTEATVAQIGRLIQAGCEIVRVTTPSMADVENLPNIRAEMKRRGFKVPLVADVHFLPQVALKACDHVEKVRVNPGNFADRKRFAVREYTDAEYGEELERIRESFVPVVLRAKENGVALRIGTNHGSLSDRIMNRYGDTPEGMVESALEFVRIAQDEGFHDLVLSMKASNPQVMIAAYRLLVIRMDSLGMDYPLHLGVTEAGEGEDGRIKSSIGIGSLLADGLGDTIRVSLTEDPEFEIPVAHQIVSNFARRAGLDTSSTSTPWNFYSYARRKTENWKDLPVSLGHKELARVRTSVPASRLGTFLLSLPRMEPPAEIASIEPTGPEFRLDLLTSIPRNVEVLLRIDRTTVADLLGGGVRFNQISIRPTLAWCESVYLSKLAKSLGNRPVWLRVTNTAELETAVSMLEVFEGLIRAGIEVEGTDLIFLGRRVASRLAEVELDTPIHLHYLARSDEKSHDLLIRASGEIGTLFCDGIGDSVEITSTEEIDFNHRLGFNILQAVRLRMSKTEYISCPSCGRTLFDLQETTARIRSKTVHLKGVKIAIMGCIVNGPGEMADADFGYVGAGPGHINLYVGKECVERGIPTEQADERLIELIRKEGRWVDPT